MANAFQQEVIRLALATGLSADQLTIGLAPVCVALARAAVFPPLT